MASSFKRKARAYTRGRRKPRLSRANRITLRAAKRQAKKEREGLLLQNVLGITSAVGYTNVHPIATSLSKLSATNFLTHSIQQKKLREKMAAFFSYYQPTSGSRLSFIIRRKDPFVLKRYLTKQIFPEEKIRFLITEADVGLGYSLHTLKGCTALGLVFYDMKGPEETWAGPSTPAQMDEAEQDLSKLYQMIGPLLEAGLVPTLQDMKLFWTLSLYTIELALNDFSILREKTMEYKDELKAHVDEEEEQYSAEYDDEASEFHRGRNGGYGFVSRRTRHRYEQAVEIQKAFDSFMKTYNANTKTFNLFRPKTPPPPREDPVYVGGPQAEFQVPPPLPLPLGNYDRF